jgi:hypothetical protein
MAHANRDPKHLLRGEIMRRWEYLTLSDVDECCSDQSRLIDMLQYRYGYLKRRAEKEAELFFCEFQIRLRMAA